MSAGRQKWKQENTKIPAVISREKYIIDAARSLLSLLCRPEVMPIDRKSLTYNQDLAGAVP